MPVYLRKGPLEIPTGSERDWANEDDDDYFLRDPDKALDYLPQPYRMIDKMLDLLIDQAWQDIITKEQIREAEKLKTKINIHQPTAYMHMARRVNCIASGKSGSYIFIGFSDQLAVYSVSDFLWVCGWEASKIEICSLNICHVKNQIYLIATVDDLGVARLFVLAESSMMILKVINEPEDISRRTNCMHFEISDGGDYAGVLLQGNQECWLEVYKLPKDTWLNELEHSQTSSANTLPSVHSPSPETKFTPPLLIMKIKPPKPLTGSSFKSLQESMQKTDDSCVFGSGQNHIISTQQWEQQETIFQKYLDAESSRITDEERSRHASFHFLQPNKILQGELEGNQTALPNALSVHWNGCHNLFMYLLATSAKDKSDADLKPDIVWPCAAAIKCSAVTSCTSFLALGLEDGTLTVWDMKYSGFPLAAVALPEGKSFGFLHFLEYPSAVGDSPSLPRTQLLAWCADKSLYLVTTGSGKESSLVLIRESPDDPDEQISAVVPVHSLPCAVLLFFRNGTVELMDVSLKKAVCQFSLPLSHWVASPWQPIYAFDSENIFLFIKGNEKMTTGEMLAAGDGPCSVFTFSMNCLPLMDSFRKTPQSPAPSAQNLSWEQKCKLLLQKRLQSFPERTKQMSESWSLLKKHSPPLLH
ncbi:WD repeat-containing protein 93 isoform 2-T2 [Pelodytes ibericus]